MSLVAVGGGNALIPALHDQAVGTMHWLNDARFVEILAVAQMAPGPNILLIPLIGWETAGFPGAALALIAFVLPSATIAVVGARFMQRHTAHSWAIALRWALRPVAAGLIVSSSLVVLETAARAWPAGSVPGTAGLTVLAVGVAGLALRYKIHPLVWLGIAAVLGAFAA